MLILVKIDDLKQINTFDVLMYNWPVSQMRTLIAACRELAIDYDILPKLLYVFGHKT